MGERGNGKSKRNSQYGRNILALSLAAATLGIALGVSETEAAEEPKAITDQGKKVKESGKSSAESRVFLKAERPTSKQSQKQSEGSKGTSSRSSIFLKRSGEEK